MRPWNNWFHICGGTYGSWLPGDPRGWRTEDHKRHVDGDYKQPPPVGMHAGLHRRSKALMKREPVVLNWMQQICLVEGLIDSLEFRSAETIDLCMAPTHFHLLCRFAKPRELLGNGETFRSDVDGTRRSADRRLCGDASAASIEPKRVMGIVKSEAARYLSRVGLAPVGGVFAAGCKVVPIRDRGHQLTVVNYIGDHVRERAVVWSIHIKGKRDNPKAAGPQTGG